MYALPLAFAERHAADLMFWSKHFLYSLLWIFMGVFYINSVQYKLLHILEVMNILIVLATVKFLPQEL